MTKFLLLLGVTGVGKSTIIKELMKLDERFVYISPYMTRQLRDGETEKISIDDDTFDTMIAEGKFLTVNKLYNVRYGTPREPIESAFQNNLFPILDFPISDLKTVESAFPTALYPVYVQPPSISILKERLTGRIERFEAAQSELEHMKENTDAIELFITNHEGRARETAATIYEQYMRSMYNKNKEHEN